MSTYLRVRTQRDRTQRVRTQPVRARRSGARRAALHLVAALAFVALLPGSSSAIYKWIDSQGKMHFAQEIHQVPGQYRAQAESRAAKARGPSPVQTYSSPASITRSPSRRGTRGGGRGGTYKIPVQRVGSTMRVQVRINDTVTAPFIIDTGASDVAVPRWVVDQAGIDLTGARTGRYSTANGIIEIPLLTLESVELGGARAEHVAAAVSDTMETGLLGLSFFNRFQYSIDPGAGVVTLVANGLEETGQIRGGRSKTQWQGEFAELNGRRTAIEAKLAESSASRGRKRARLETALAEVERQYRLLEGEADDAKVPFGWRD